MRTFGQRARPVKVRLEFVRNQEKVLRALTEFLYKNAKLIRFDERKLQADDCWRSIFRAILDEKSTAHKVFISNLEQLIIQNIKESGLDPRILGPPEHIANQVVIKIDDILDEIAEA